MLIGKKNEQEKDIKNCEDTGRVCVVDNYI